MKTPIAFKDKTKYEKADEKGKFLNVLYSSWGKKFLKDFLMFSKNFKGFLRFLRVLKGFIRFLKLDLYDLINIEIKNITIYGYYMSAKSNMQMKNTEESEFESFSPKTKNII